MIGELIQTGITFNDGRVAINNSFSATSYNNIINSNITFGTILSGNTIYSGATDLSLLFAQKNISATFPFSASSINNSINPIKGGNISSGNYSIVLGGIGNVSSGNYSVSQGKSTSATSFASHAEGYKTLASGGEAHSEGNQTSATSTASHAEGYKTLASGNYSHAEGRLTIASSPNAHAEGRSTIASGAYSHAQGSGTTASGAYSHAEGQKTTASAKHSHVGGSGSTVSGQASFIHSSNSDLLSPNSSIIGGYKNRLNAVATGSTILGGSNITGSTADTVYVSNLTATTNIYAQNIFSGTTNISSLFGPTYSLGTSTNISFSNSYTNGGSQSGAARYRIDSLGNVRLLGTVRSPASVTNVIFTTLPVGYRPATAKQIPVGNYTNGTSQQTICYIETNGDCRLYNGSGTFVTGNVDFTLDPIFFNIND